MISPILQARSLSLRAVVISPRSQSSMEVRIQPQTSWTNSHPWTIFINTVFPSSHQPTPSLPLDEKKLKVHRPLEAHDFLHDCWPFHGTRIFTYVIAYMWAICLCGLYSDWKRKGTGGREEVHEEKVEENGFQNRRKYMCNAALGGRKNAEERKQPRAVVRKKLGSVESHIAYRGPILPSSAECSSTKMP